MLQVQNFFQYALHISQIIKIKITETYFAKEKHTTIHSWSESPTKYSLRVVKCLSKKYSA